MITNVGAALTSVVLVAQLCGHEGVVETVFDHELLVGAHLLGNPVLEGHDDVSRTDGGEAVGYDNCGPTFAGLIENLNQELETKRS